MRVTREALRTQAPERIIEAVSLEQNFVLIFYKGN